MPESAERSNFLPSISIVTAAKSYLLRALSAPGPEREGERVRSLAAEAMRWSYVLRSRERWRDSVEVQARHQRDAAATLQAFGLGETEQREIAQAGRVVVTMPYDREAVGWDGRIFPWEYLLSRATRPYRGAGQGLTVMRHLKVSGAKPWPAQAMGGRVLCVKSQPGALADAYDLSEEAERMRAALGMAAGDARWREITTPTLAELEAACRDFRPEVVHVAGFDNHQGLLLLREQAGDEARVVQLGGDVTSVGECLRGQEGVLDGVVMRLADGTPALVGPQQLGQALTAGRQHRPFLVSLNLWNSAPRTAPMLLPSGVLAAIGFQDAFDDALAEYFFETLYTQLAAQSWHLPGAFEQAWVAMRRQADLLPGTGIALWASEAPLGAAPPVSLRRRAAARAPAAPAPAPAPATTGARVAVAAAPAAAAPLSVLIEPRKEFNYAELHNQSAYADQHNQSALFDRFELRGAVTQPPLKVHVLVELNCGPERARYESDVELTQQRMSLKGQIKVPLTAMLIRSVSEAVVSSLFVQVQAGGVAVHKETYALRLMPVDQWLDNAHSGPWLPSFVLPRDPAVERAITAAQRYVRVIRDDPSAGFEGYQSATSDDPDSLDNVDLQVEAIWAALLHEWQLGYINPPPTYNRALDSQRLRTPSAVWAMRMGTCIDLALLFAACLELVDIHPVVFLLEGHALPGYWRHRDYQQAFREVINVPETVTPSDETRSASPSAQSRPWRVGRAGYREVWKQIREGRLAPLETVRLTEHCGFREAREAGIDALKEPRDFDSILDIAIAREQQVTPLPIATGERG